MVVWCLYEAAILRGGFLIVVGLGYDKAKFRGKNGGWCGEIFVWDFIGLFLINEVLVKTYDECVPLFTCWTAAD
jgi:hypothetical protein